MSDQKLRELERRWRETGSPDDKAAYLLERVRVGDLTQERLELAAYCGHEGARRAVGLEPTTESGPFGPWVARVVGQSQEVAIQVALIVAKIATSAWECVNAAQVQAGTFLNSVFPPSAPPFSVAEIPYEAVSELERTSVNGDTTSSYADILARAESIRFLGSFAAIPGGYSASWAFQAVLEALRTPVDNMAAKISVDHLVGSVANVPVSDMRRFVPWMLDEQAARTVLSTGLVAWALRSAQSKSDRRHLSADGEPPKG
ncbi:MAG: hypothetical protein KIT58_00945 [Planctomycetota bacterium]|nr:hypothetical protein [Planctomycetota bacterium]